MAKVPIERQIMVLADLMEHAATYDHDREAAEAAMRTLEFAKANRKYFELAALIAKDETVTYIESEFPGAKITAVRRIGADDD